jgi:hypothetical protein
MPDITPAQILAVIGNVIAVAVAFGVHLTKGQQDAILAVAGSLGALLIASDAHLRGRRVHALALRHVAEVQAGIAPGAPASPTPQP